jgi:hypothetical protein
MVSASADAANLAIIQGHQWFNINNGTAPNCTMSLFVASNSAIAHCTIVHDTRLCYAALFDGALNDVMLRGVMSFHCVPCKAVACKAVRAAELQG